MLLARADEVIELVRIEPVQVQLTTAPETSTARFRTASHRSSRPPAVCGLAQSQSTARPLCAVMMTEFGLRPAALTGIGQRCVRNRWGRSPSGTARAAQGLIWGRGSPRRPSGSSSMSTFEFDGVTVFEAACKMGLEGRAPSARSSANAELVAAIRRVHHDSGDAMAARASMPPCGHRDGAKPGTD